MQDARPKWNGDVSSNLCAAMMSAALTSCMILQSMSLVVQTEASAVHKDDNARDVDVAATAGIWQSGAPACRPTHGRDGEERELL